MKRKTIVHFIVDLTRGGAEMSLVKVLKELKEYKNIVVTLTDKNHFQGELECDEYISLGVENEIISDIELVEISA